MAVENQTDRFHQNNSHIEGFIVTDGGAGFEDLTGRVVKWAMSLVSATDGTFDPASIALEKSSTVGGNMTRVNDSGGEIDVNIDPADTISVTPGDYHFQLEVFDTMGLNGVVVASGVLTLLPNLIETI